MENRDFRISEITRSNIEVQEPLFATEKGVTAFYKQASEIAFKYNEEKKKEGKTDFYLSAGKLNASAVLHLVYQVVLSYLMDDGQTDFFSRRLATVENNEELKTALDFFSNEFPSELLKNANPKPTKAIQHIEDLRGFFIYQVMVDNPALINATKPLLTPDGLVLPSTFRALSSVLSSYVKDDLRDGTPNTSDIFTLLTLPARLFPNSLNEQLGYILREWAIMLPLELRTLLELSMDYIREEEKDHGFGGAPGPMPVIDYSEENNEYEAFSDDSNWMPKVVMMAKSTLVWLDQLSKKYEYPITTLDQIPDAELDLLQERGFTALWLIGLWERSSASAEIKHLCGNPDAVASAYSLKDYDISPNIGGWQAVDNLRERCARRGIRLASDMVPNHTGIDGNWVYEHPDYYISQDYPPFPNYTYNGPDLSTNPDWEVKIEDHYYDRTDAAVTFRLTDKRSGQTRYVFHGNDGTTMPWNDTAQLDYLNPVTREAVIQKIIHVAKNFPIIRFDAAMTLAKRHIERLWYPKPGTGGDIAGRTSHAMDTAEFNKRIPEEFWREVVDRIAIEVPDTLLLAEAFWMMEGYFVRTLGMHRVYNSAFMNMLKNQENQKYRQSIKNTLEFEPEILKRYVNFMNNPDEDTAIAQFGDGDRYFAIATLLSTLPGLPMIGHGQIEGYREKYGMEYQRAYYDEKPNEWLISEHYRRIFPLLRKRQLFSNVDNFNLYDCYDNGNIQESVYAFINGVGNERTLVLVNNQYERAGGNIHTSCKKLSKQGDDKRLVSISIAENLSLHFSPSHYVLMDNFSDGLTYIMPSISIFDYGFNFFLNGYEARVFWNIREVEDTDGVYERLYKEYQNKGIKNIRIAVGLMRLQPIYKVMNGLKAPDTLKQIEDIVSGKGTKTIERALLLTLAEAYSKLFELYPTLDETVKSMVGIEPEDVDPAPVVKLIRNISKLFSNKNGEKTFRSWASIDNTLTKIIATSLFLLPFQKGKDHKKMMEISDRLLLEYFFEVDEQVVDENTARALAHEGALLVSATNLYEEMAKAPIETDPITIVSALLNDTGVMNLTQCNEYKGEIWYNKESMQKVILIATLAYALASEDNEAKSDYFARTLLEQEMNSEYKLRLLLKTK